MSRPDFLRTCSLEEDCFRPLGSRKIQQHHIRALLRSFEDNFTAVWGDVEVSDVEVGSEVCQLPRSAPVSRSMRRRFLC